MLERLRICDCAALTVAHMQQLSAATSMQTLVLGAFPSELRTHVPRLLAALPRCTEAHFHDVTETPCDAGFG